MYVDIIPQKNYSGSFILYSMVNTDVYIKYNFRSIFQSGIYSCIFAYRNYYPYFCNHNTGIMTVKTDVNTYRIPVVLN